MSTRFKVFREYTSDDSFLNLVIPENITEFQVVLAYAIDYDGTNSTNGVFTPTWDTQKVTPDVIKNYKKKYESRALRVKVFLSIGNNTKEQPFTLGSNSDKDTWVSQAIASLTDIIKTYHLDGIDVTYEDIEANQNDFVSAIGEVVKSLKGNKVITSASIAPSATTTNDNYYVPLFQNYGTYFESVVFHSFIGFTPSRANPIKSLEAKIVAAADQYTSVKWFLVGYSAIKEDWSNFSPPIFFITLHELLPNSKVAGASLKFISDTVASFPAPWVPEVLSLAASKTET